MEWSGPSADRGRAAITCLRMSRRAEDRLTQYVIMLCSQRLVERAGLRGDSVPIWGGEANSISYGLKLVLVLLRIRIYIKTKGRHLVHGSPVCSQHLASLVFKMPFSLSTAPPEAG